MFSPTHDIMVANEDCAEADLLAAARWLAAASDEDPLRCAIKQAQTDGQDILGDRFCALRDAKTRRLSGAVYTPTEIIDVMIDWAKAFGKPDRIVDAGCGSGRFLLAAGEAFPKASLIGFDTDELACELANANLAVAGFARRAEVLCEDFLQADVDHSEGPTLWIGNPPYVRHHHISQQTKDWMKKNADLLGYPSSGLSGLHVYFLLAIARKAKPGDFGVQITSAEWLDVNYGKLVRALFTGRLGGRSVVTLDAKAEPFPGTATTGAISTFEIGRTAPAPTFSNVATTKQLKSLDDGKPISRNRLLSESRWSHFTRVQKDIPEGFVELGELCRVHRGQVTGANAIWIEGEHSVGLPDHVFYPTVTKARDLISAGERLDDGAALRRVVDLPRDLSELSKDDYLAVMRFLKKETVNSARFGYVAKNRRAWWSVDLREPAPILVTYMARQAPSFVINEAGARHINIAHGLYPREVLSKELIETLAAYLRSTASVDGGRVYAGGLTKFEPREMERIPIPNPHMLNEMTEFA